MSDRLPGCLVLLPGLLVLSAGLAFVSAQDAPRVTDPAVLLLARTCVSERGWRVDTDDCAAIGAVARWRAREHHGGDVAAALVALSPRLHGRECSVTRRWLCDLSADCSRPDGLGAPWDRPRGDLPSRRASWETTLAEAETIISDPSLSPCSSEPHAWGSEADVARRLRRGHRWTEIDCGRTVNRFGIVRER